MVYNKINLMLPTYKRHDTLLPIYINSALDTARVKNINFSFCVNKKDQGTIDFLNSYDWPHGCEWEMILESSIQPNLSKYFNLMYDTGKFSSPSTLVTMTGDDMEFKTQGWDLKILEIINNYAGIGVFWCNDDYIAHERLCVNLFVSRKMVEATRRPFMCPMYHADMIDWVWMEIGKLTNTGHYLRDVIIKHNHNTMKAADDWDETFSRLRPVQQVANEKRNQKIGKVYANIVAAELIQQGIGNW